MTAMNGQHKLTDYTNCLKFSVQKNLTITIINSTLTPNYIQFKAIEVYKELVNSKNTTFIVMPTSPNGAGIPLILNADGSEKK